MKENEANRLRDIADVLDDHYNDFPKNSTNKEAHWFRWAAEAIRGVIFNSGFNAFNDAKYDKTCTTWQLDKEE